MVLTPNDHRDNSHVLVTPTTLPIHPVCAQPTRTPVYSSTARGWFKIDDQMIRKDMVGLEDSLVLLMNVLAEHNFEVRMSLLAWHSHIDSRRPSSGSAKEAR